MAFDEKKDKVLLGPKIGHKSDTTKIVLEIHSYNNGSPKLQINRKNKSGDDWKFAKLGRMTFEEWEGTRDMADKMIREHSKKGKK